MGWIVLGAAMAVMYRVALMEQRSGPLWAVVTLIIVVGLDHLIGVIFIAAAAGLVASFAAMFIVKLIEEKNTEKPPPV